MTQSIDEKLFSLQSIEGQVGYTTQAEVRHEVPSYNYPPMNLLQKGFLTLSIVAGLGTIYGAYRFYKAIKKPTNLE